VLLSEVNQKQPGNYDGQEPIKGDGNWRLARSFRGVLEGARGWTQTSRPLLSKAKNPDLNPPL